jgi:phosphohistidine phosphatase SixA
VLAPLAAAEPVPPAAGVNVFLLRHAEKDSNDARDPDLNALGRARAAELARVLGGTHVTHLFASEFKRTQQTLQPLAERTGVQVRVVPAGDAAAQIDALRQLPAGSTAVVAGHSNTIPALVEKLGGSIEHLEETPRGRMLADAEHDRLFLVVLPAPGARAETAPRACVELRYGAAAPATGSARTAPERSR